VWCSETLVDASLAGAKRATAKVHCARVPGSDEGHRGDGSRSTHELPSLGGLGRGRRRCGLPAPV